VRTLLEEADRLAAARALPELAQLEVSTHAGSVFVVRRDGRLIAAATRPDPTVGLVLYDLKHCIGSLEDAPGRAVANGKRPVEKPTTGSASPRPRRPRTRKADSSA
jgi:hypothetical protein